MIIKKIGLDRNSETSQCLLSLPIMSCGIIMFPKYDTIQKTLRAPGCLNDKSRASLQQSTNACWAARISDGDLCSEN